MKVKAIRAFLLAGERVDVGAEVEVPDMLGRELCAYNKTVRVAGQPAAPAGPLTTETAAPVVKGRRAPIQLQKESTT